MQKNKIYLLETFYYDESIHCFFYNEAPYYELMGPCQKALICVVKASAKGKCASKEIVFAKAFDNEYDTFYNEQRDGKRVKALIRRLRYKLSQLGIVLPRAVTQGYYINILKTEPEEIISNKPLDFNHTKQKEKKATADIVLFDNSIYQHILEYAIRESCTKYYEYEKSLFEMTIDISEQLDDEDSIFNDKDMEFAYRRRALKSAFFYDIWLNDNIDNIKIAQNELMKLLGRVTSEQEDIFIVEVVKESLAAYLIKTDTTGASMDRIIALTEQAISINKSILRSRRFNYSLKGMLFEPHTPEDVKMTIAWLMDNLGLYLLKNNRLEDSEKYLKKALYIRKQIYNRMWPIEMARDRSIAWTCINIAELMVKEKRYAEAMHYCTTALDLLEELQSEYSSNNYETLMEKAKSIYDLVSGY